MNDMLHPATEPDNLHDQIWKEIEASDGDDSAARAMLAAGIPIYYREADTPPGLDIKEYPDGRRELVKFSRQGDQVISTL